MPPQKSQKLVFCQGRDSRYCKLTCIAASSQKTLRKERTILTIFVYRSCLHNTLQLSRAVSSFSQPNSTDMFWSPSRMSLPSAAFRGGGGGGEEREWSGAEGRWAAKCRTDDTSAVTRPGSYRERRGKLQPQAVRNWGPEHHPGDWPLSWRKDGAQVMSGLESQPGLLTANSAPLFAP